MTVFRRDAFLDRTAPAALLSDSAQAIDRALFVDARAPDAADLLDTAKPGQAAFLIDGAQDGFRQVAHILAAHDLSDLSAIDLVGHGGGDGPALGSTVLDDASLSNHAADLALIGRSLSSHGDLSLYGATASHAGTGLEFVSDLTPAAVHTTTAAPDVFSTAAVPQSARSDAALLGHTLAPDIQPAGSTPQSVATAGDPDLFILSDAGGAYNALQTVSDTGSYPDNAVTTFFSGSSNEPSALDNNVARVALDPQNNAYFIEVANIGENKIILGSLSGLSTTATETLTTIYSDLAPAQTGLDGSTTRASITGIALDPVGKEVYFTEGDQFKEVSYTGGAATVLGTATYAAGPPVSPNYLDGVALDLTDHTAYFDAKQEVITTAKTPGGGFKTPGGGVTHVSGTFGYYTTTFVNAIWKDSNTTASGQALTKLPLSGLPGVIEDVAIDPAHQFLYITTDSAAGSAAGIYKYQIGGGGAVTTVYQEGGAITGALGDIVVDAQGKYYVTVNNGLNAGDVYVGSTSGGTPTLLYAIPTTLNTNGTDTQPVDVAVDLAPTLTLPAVTATQPLQGGAAVQVLTGTPTASDPDGVGVLEGATVSLGSTYKAGDVLAAITTGTSITASYTGGVLTLSGNDTYAHYQQVLASITYQDGASDAGAHPLRTLSFSTTDGLVSSAVQIVTLTLDHAPVANPDTVTAVVGGGAVTGNVLSNDTDTDNDILGLTSGGNQTGTYGALTLNLNGSYSYTPNASISAPTGSHPIDSFTYTASDGHGGVANGALTFTLDRAPILSGLAGPVSYSEGASATAVGSAAAVSDPDGDPIASASVTIASGLLAADTLSVDTTGTAIAASYTGGVLTLSGADTAAHYQQVLDSLSFSTPVETAATYVSGDDARTLAYTLSDGTASGSGSQTIDVGVVFSDTAANVAATLDALTADAGVSAINITDGQPLAITSAQSMTDKVALGEIVGPYELDVTGITGQAFTGFTRDYDGSGHLTGETLNGYTNRSYTSLSETFDASGRVLDKTYFDASHTDVRMVDKIYNAGSSFTETISHINNATHTGYTSDYDSSHTLVARQVYLTNGTEHDYAYASGQTFASKSVDQTEFAIGANETFVIQAGFGHDRIDGYTGGNDSFDISTAVFTDFNDLLAHATAHGHHDTLITYDAADSVLILGVTPAELAQHSADFTFS